MPDEPQIKSRERVRDRGEVFTAPREVNAMCDLVEPTISAADSTVLEPACGTGNFLVPILERKLERILSLPDAKDPAAFLFKICRVTASLYGIDILPDNVETTRARLVECAEKFYETHAQKGRYWHGTEKLKAFPDALRMIALRNILAGDALTMKTNDGDWLRFTKWLVAGQSFQCVEYEYRQLLREKPAMDASQPMFVFEPFVDKNSMRDDRLTHVTHSIEKLAEEWRNIYGRKQ